MTTKKLDYSKSTKDIFYKIIYPLYAKEFLFGDYYIEFAILIEQRFILNPTQWDYILHHWDEKESILKTIEKK